MAIKMYFEINNPESCLWKIYVNVRSKVNPQIRAQRRLLGVKTQREAEREETRLIRECEREIALKENQGSSWKTLLEEWERCLKLDTAVKASLETRNDYIAAIYKHTHSWLKRPASEISVSDVREILNQMKAHSSSMSYQNKIKVIINKIFVFGIESGIVKGVDRSPAHGVRIGRIEVKKPEILTNTEIRKLLEEARNLNHPWYHVWALALLTGMRNGELYALNWSDIDWENRLLSITKSYNCKRRAVKSTKSDDWSAVPISSELSALLLELKNSNTDKHILPRLPNWNKGGQARELRKFCIGIGL